MIAAFQESKWILLLLALFFIVQSCAGTKYQQPPKELDQNTAQRTALARQHIEAGKYQNAIDEYTTEYRTHPQDHALVKEYVQSLEDIKIIADKASNKKDFASAGKIYDVLLRNDSYFMEFGQTLSFDKDQLTIKLSHCKEALSAKGFQEYREGNINKAIAVWQSLLVIDPDNADIKGALKTAKLQQKNLKERTNGQ
jgi:tetratricopeptide (TPR) repeat protein